LPYYCYNCDDFFKYNLIKKYQKICPVCNNEFYAYYRDKKVALRWAPIKARCLHCSFLGKDSCPENGDLIDPFYNKACKFFQPKKGINYRKE